MQVQHPSEEGQGLSGVGSQQLRNEVWLFFPPVLEMMTGVFLLGIKLLQGFLHLDHKPGQTFYCNSHLQTCQTPCPIRGPPQEEVTLAAEEKMMLA